MDSLEAVQFANFQGIPRIFEPDPFPRLTQLPGTESFFKNLSPLWGSYNEMKKGARQTS